MLSLRATSAVVAVAETSSPHPGTVREVRAIPRGFGGRALAHPNRRRRVRGLEGAAARVFLCWQVGRFGFAPDSPWRTESSNSTCSATQSAAAETSRPHPGTAREIPAIARGFGRRALVYPNRRLRVAGLEVAAARVFLWCQVGRFGFAPDSPQRRLRLSRPILKVRLLLSPPPSLLLQRLRARIQEQPETFPRFRGVLAVERWCIRTGDCGFRP